MRKIYLLFLTVSALLTTATKAQVGLYAFNQTGGTYTPITGGTVLATQTIGNGTAAGALDDVVYTTPLPFNFVYAGVTYNSGTNINVSTNGFISFGAAPAVDNYLPVSGAANNTIAAFGFDCNGGWGAAGTTTTGSAEITALTNTSGFEVGALVFGTGVPAGATIVSINPNVSITISVPCTSSGTSRTISCATGEIRAEQVGADFIIQFKNMRKYNVVLNRINAQIRLTQTTNTVTVVYGDWFAAVSNTPQVGLRGTSSIDFNNRTSTTSWSASTAGGSNTATMTWSGTVFPAIGQTYTWTVPTTGSVDYCNLQFPATSTIALGANETVYTRGYEPGVTEAAGPGSGITVWIGANTANTDPATWPVTAWVPATFNVQTGNDDEFQAAIGSTLGAGTHYYASRWRLETGPYRYGGYTPTGGGFWDGTTNVSGVLTITPAVANDICSGAISLTVNATPTCAAQTAGTTVGASQSTDVAPSCGAAGGWNDDVWFSFVATGPTHIVTLSNVSGTTDMAMAAYSGACGSLTQITCSDPNAMTVTGLTSGQTYYVRVWTYTATAATTATFDICITSPPPPPANDNICNATALSVSPGVTCTTSLTGQSSQYATQSLTSCAGTADEDIWYSFVATSATHFVTLTNSGSGATDRVHQVYSSSDNTCNGTLTSITCSDPETSTSNGLVPGNTYFVRVHSYGSTNYATFDICITSPAPPPANDGASGAITLTVGAGCTAAPYTNVGGTQATNEKFASCFQSATTGTGNTIATHTVWYKFVATGTAVKVTTDVTGGTLSDTHIGLFTATNESDYATFNIVSCDDDNGSTGTLRSTLYATGLTVGQTYYVSVDGYNGTTGTFCLTVDNLASTMLSTANTCASTYQNPSGVQTSYTGQVPIVDASGNLVAIVRNPAGGAVNGYTAAQNINSAGIRQSTETGIYYLDRNFRITNSTATNVEVQFFFLASELAALNTADGTTLGNMAVTRQLELVSGCQANFSSANGATIVLPQTANGTSIDGNVNWIQVTTPGFSNFYLNKIGTTLPVTIEYFRGTKQNNRNVLDWKVSCYNSPSVTLILQRSSDGRQFKDISTTTESATRCLQPFNYNDLSPLAGINYYRLKSIDVDRKVSYSNVVALLNKDKGFEIVSLAPNPVQDEAILSVTSAEKTIMEIVVSDLNGKQISKQRVSLIAGNNQLPLNLRKVAAGTYQVTGLTADGLSRTLRFVKQ